MDAKVIQLIYHTVQTSNILPITSVCNVSVSSVAIAKIKGY